MKTKLRDHLSLALRGVGIFTLVALPAGAATPQAKPASTVHRLDEFSVVGSKSAIELLPGSAAFIESAELRVRSIDDINLAVRAVPGVYQRQEDGYGLFPNISLRGVSSTRNSKITVMEDGILTSPAPYAGPAAYYTPTIGRMAALEILKGSSQIRFGPQTTGGVLNYLSTPIPEARTGSVSALYGSHAELRVHAWMGETLSLPSGARLGWLLENYYRTTDGFKTIQGSEGYTGSDQTGFTRNEPMLKLRFETADRRQSVEAKAGYTGLNADETYLGLTEEDFRDDPYQRYAASRFDNIDTRQFRSYVRHRLELSPDVALSSTAYFNRFDRAWYKLAAARLGTGSFRNLSQILAGQYGPDLVGVLKGEVEGGLRVRNNKRSYDARGLESILRAGFDVGESRHQIDAGIRWHRDSEERFQNDDIYSLNAAGAVTDISRGAPGTQDNRTGEAEALALHLMDRITVGDLTLTPGIRWERIDFTNTRRSTTPGPNFNQTNPGFPQERTLDVWAPGLGFTWAAGYDLSWFGGVHRGVSVPGPGDVTGSSRLSEETALGWELGARFRRGSAFWGEAVLFHTDFDNLIVPDNIGGGGVAGRTENVGRARTQGLELLVGFDPAAVASASWRAPSTLSLTWTDATIQNDVNAAGSGGGAVEGIFAGGRSGNQIPYIPEWQINLASSLDFGNWGVLLNGFYVASVYGTANNTGNLRQGSDAQGPLDSRFGRVPSYFVMDVTAHYQFSQSLRLKVGVENVLDRAYLVSRLPHGPRPGQPRFVFAGADVVF